MLHSNRENHAEFDICLFLLKRTVNLISSDPPFKDWFISVPLKLCLLNNMENIVFFLPEMCYNLKITPLFVTRNAQVTLVQNPQMKITTLHKRKTRISHTWSNKGLNVLKRKKTTRISQFSGFYCSTSVILLCELYQYAINMYNFRYMYITENLSTLSCYLNLKLLNWASR